MKCKVWNRLSFLIKRLQERLWIRPLVLCILSVIAAMIARAADDLGIERHVPAIDSDSIETLLSITAGSMLVIATLAVTSMVSAYASASNTATPRSFSLLVADDLSKNALSTFLGAFIFTFVALVALKNGYYEKTGLFVLFVMTAGVVAFVIVMFVRWVDWIARLGRIGTTVEKVEAAGIEAFERNRLSRRLGGAARDTALGENEPIFGDKIGYVRHVNMENLQAHAEEHDIRITLAAVPGTFIAPGRPLAYLHHGDDAEPSFAVDEVIDAFEIGDHRVYDDDPRFALVALSEIASRALSPAVNDPGTAIAVFGSMIRMFAIFAKPLAEDEASTVQFDRIFVPDLAVDDMLEDAFRAIARDGAGIVEVQIRLQKALQSIATLPHEELAEAAKRRSREALSRAENAVGFDPDVRRVAAAARWSS